MSRVVTVVNDSDAPVFDLSLVRHPGPASDGRAAPRVGLLPGEIWQQTTPVSLQHSADCDQVFAGLHVQLGEPPTRADLQ